MESGKEMASLTLGKGNDADPGERSGVGIGREADVVILRWPSDTSAIKTLTDREIGSSGFQEQHLRSENNGEPIDYCIYIKKGL